MVRVGLWMNLSVGTSFLSQAEWASHRIKPVIHEILNKRDSFGRVTLIYGARNPADILFSDDIRIWRKYIEVLLTVDEVPADVARDHNVGLVTDFWMTWH
jgi:NAD(P)H-flavin reductase